MADPTIDVLKDHLRQLRLPTMGQEFEKLARDAAATNQNFFQFLLGVIAPVPRNSANSDEFSRKEWLEFLPVTLAY